ncbi:unnamed protein product [Adineta steineri]|uniref:Uncharacterized protein n=1 Tax=Adineta steineri TaxID=433720 RepID=A0A815SDQ8_9BILA|nr:unnamed protein product [Adineta steineri]CAF4113353.1 unnamed protein product [Adineta steineri]
MVKIIHVNKIQLNNQSIEQINQHQLMNNKFILSDNIKRSSIIIQPISYQCNNNQVVPDNQQTRISLNKRNIFDYSNNNLFDNRYKNKEENHRRKSIAFPWLKLWCCCLICAALILIGLIVTIAILISLHNSKTTTSITSTYTTTLTTSTTTTTIISPSNWLINGDGESGLCSTNNSVVHPTGWNLNGSITQVYYNNSEANILSTDPGPNNRGRCFFYGGPSPFDSSMWQYVNMSNLINPILIDNQTIYFNFSAWIGGYQGQTDNAQVSLTFLNQINQQVGSTFTLGPVTNTQRSNQTSLLFQSSNGFVPVGARSFLVMVKINFFQGYDNDGNIDNIDLYLHQ